jgi:large subunit ribosomal protein L22
MSSASDTLAAEKVRTSRARLYRRLGAVLGSARFQLAGALIAGVFGAYAVRELYETAQRQQRELERFQKQAQETQAREAQAKFQSQVQREEAELEATLTATLGELSEFGEGSSLIEALVIDQIRGQRVNDALALLKFSKKHAAEQIEKTLNSAVANAEQAARAANTSLDVDALVITTAIVNEGPKLKRWTPAAMGRATPMLKRTSHVEIVVTEAVR